MRWLLIALVLGGCATKPHIVWISRYGEIVKTQGIEGFKRCRVQWCPSSNAWFNYDNYETCDCAVIYIPQEKYCFKRVDGSIGSKCP